MRALSRETLADWLANAEALEQDERGVKVARLANGQFLKLFHLRRHVWRARLFPPAERFARNAAALAARGFVVPEEIETFWVDQKRGLSGCCYRPLPGVTLETLLARTPETIPPLLPDLAGFIRELHEKGVYFRALHLGNILALPRTGSDLPQSFGLIDVLDLRLYARPLSAWRITRNFRHLRASLLRRRQDFPLESLFSLYAQK
ncbi:MAG: hypothetical protein LBR88_03395 [Zoogloeaceae bacterium]|jgi:hypothetical protein|nr:hypothetical protein [Zoogloeaceae bacterium]